jgi:hypothetical protein
MFIFIRTNGSSMSICISTTSIISTLIIDQSLSPIRTDISIPASRTIILMFQISTIGTFTDDGRGRKN